jgi:hypothetical protein
MKKYIWLLFWWFLFVNEYYGIALTQGPFADEKQCNSVREQLKLQRRSASNCWDDGRK